MKSMFATNSDIMISWYHHRRLETTIGFNVIRYKTNVTNNYNVTEHNVMCHVGGGSRRMEESNGVNQKPRYEHPCIHSQSSSQTDLLVQIWGNGRMKWTLQRPPWWSRIISFTDPLYEKPNLCDPLKLKYWMPYILTDKSIPFYSIHQIEEMEHRRTSSSIHPSIHPSSRGFEKTYVQHSP